MRLWACIAPLPSLACGTLHGAAQRTGPVGGGQHSPGHYTSPRPPSAHSLQHSITPGHPLNRLTILLLRGPAGPLGVPSPGRPPLCGVTRSPRRPMSLLCATAVQGYTGSGWGDPGWGGGGPGRPWVACGCCSGASTRTTAGRVPAACRVSPGVWVRVGWGSVCGGRPGQRAEDRAPGPHTHGNTAGQVVDGLRTEVCGQQKQTRCSTRREEWVTLQGPIKKQQPDGMSHRRWGGGWRGGGSNLLCVLWALCVDSDPGLEEHFSCTWTPYPVAGVSGPNSQYARSPLPPPPPCSLANEDLAVFPLVRPFSVA